MTNVNRRPLVAGLKPADPTREKEFVFGGKAKAEQQQPAPVPVPREGTGRGGAVSRVGLSTRVRSDFAVALKRASLERQLAGVVPNTLQDILEEALEPWLRANGYLS
jgi:hypothetical protein